MEDTRPTLVNFIKSEGKLLFEALQWLTKFKRYRDDMTGGKHSKANIYNDVWVKIIRRIKNNIENDNKLILLYEWFKKPENSIDQEIKEIILKNLKDEGQKRELVYFTNIEIIKGWLK